MRRILAPCLAALSLLAARPAAAQDEGARVRVAPSWRVSGERWIVGTVVARGPDSLTLLRADTRETVSLHRADLNRVEVSTGRRPTLVTVARYSVLGAAVGGAAGALLGHVVHDDDSLFSHRGSMAAGAALVGTPSLLVGGLVGWMTSGAQWSRVPLTPAVVAGPHGAVGLSLSLRR